LKAARWERQRTYNLAFLPDQNVSRIVIELTEWIKVCWMLTPTSKQDSNQIRWGSFHRMEEFDNAVEMNQEWRGSV
jgi:hypothetical protein